jgi:hypothetical protein
MVIPFEWGSPGVCVWESGGYGFCAVPAVTQALGAGTLLHRCGRSLRPPSTEVGSHGRQTPHAADRTQTSHTADPEQAASTANHVLLKIEFHARH